MSNSEIIEDYFVINYHKNDKDDYVHFLTHIETGMQTEDLKKTISCTARIIFTSCANALILKLHFNHSKNIVGIEMGKTYQVLSRNNSKFIFTCIKSNYNCGAMMLIARGDFGTIIYTGPSAITIDGMNIPTVSEIVKQHALTKLYLDCTYHDTDFKFISIKNIEKLLVKFFIERKNTFYIHVPKFGLEDLLAHVACALREKMVVDEKRMKLIQFLGLAKYFTLDQSKGRLHVISQGIMKRNSRNESCELVYLEVVDGKATQVNKYRSSGKIHHFVIYPHCTSKNCSDIIYKMAPQQLVPIVYKKNNSKSSRPSEATSKPGETTKINLEEKKDCSSSLSNEEASSDDSLASIKDMIKSLDGSVNLLKIDKRPPPSSTDGSGSSYIKKGSNSRRNKGDSKLLSGKPLVSHQKKVFGTNRFFKKILLLRKNGRLIKKKYIPRTSESSVAVKSPDTSQDAVRQVDDPATCDDETDCKTVGEVKHRSFDDLHDGIENQAVDSKFTSPVKEGGSDDVYTITNDEYSAESKVVSKGGKFFCDSRHRDDKITNRSAVASGNRNFVLLNNARENQVLSASSPVAFERVDEYTSDDRTSDSARPIRSSTPHGQTDAPTSLSVAPEEVIRICVTKRSTQTIKHKSATCNSVGRADKQNVILPIVRAGNKPKQNVKIFKLLRNKMSPKRIGLEECGGNVPDCDEDDVDKKISSTCEKRLKMIPNKDSVFVEHPYAMPPDRSRSQNSNITVVVNSVIVDTEKTTNDTKYASSDEKSVVGPKRDTDANNKESEAQNPCLENCDRFSKEKFSVVSKLVHIDGQPNAGDDSLCAHDIALSKSSVSSRPKIVETVREENKEEEITPGSRFPAAPENSTKVKVSASFDLGTTEGRQVSCTGTEPEPQNINRVVKAVKESSVEQEITECVGIDGEHAGDTEKPYEERRHDAGQTAPCEKFIGRTENISAIVTENTKPSENQVASVEADFPEEIAATSAENRQRINGYGSDREITSIDERSPNKGRDKVLDSLSYDLEADAESSVEQTKIKSDDESLAKKVSVAAGLSESINEHRNKLMDSKKRISVHKNQHNTDLSNKNNCDKCSILILKRDGKLTKFVRNKDDVSLPLTESKIKTGNKESAVNNSADDTLDEFSGAIKRDKLWQESDDEFSSSDKELSALMKQESARMKNKFYKRTTCDRNNLNVTVISSDEEVDISKRKKSTVQRKFPRIQPRFILPKVNRDGSKKQNTPSELNLPSTSYEIKPLPGNSKGIINNGKYIDTSDKDVHGTVHAKLPLVPSLSTSNKNICFQDKNISLRRINNSTATSEINSIRNETNDKNRVIPAAERLLPKPPRLTPIMKFQNPINKKTSAQRANMKVDNSKYEKSAIFSEVYQYILQAIRNGSLKKPGFYKFLNKRIYFTGKSVMIPSSFFRLFSERSDTIAADEIKGPLDLPGKVCIPPMGTSKNGNFGFRRVATKNSDRIETYNLVSDSSDDDISSVEVVEQGDSNLSSNCPGQARCDSPDQEDGVQTNQDSSPLSRLKVKDLSQLLEKHFDSATDVSNYPDSTSLQTDSFKEETPTNISSAESSDLDCNSLSFKDNMQAIGGAVEPPTAAELKDETDLETARTETIRRNCRGNCTFSRRTKEKFLELHKSDECNNEVVVEENNGLAAVSDDLSESTLDDCGKESVYPSNTVDKCWSVEQFLESLNRSNYELDQLKRYNINSEPILLMDRNLEVTGYSYCKNNNCFVLNKQTRCLNEILVAQTDETDPTMIADSSDEVYDVPTSENRASCQSPLNKTLNICSGLKPVVHTRLVVASDNSVLSNDDSPPQSRRTRSSSPSDKLSLVHRVSAFDHFDKNNVSYEPIVESTVDDKILFEGTESTCSNLKEPGSNELEDIQVGSSVRARKIDHEKLRPVKLSDCNLPRPSYKSTARSPPTKILGKKFLCKKLILMNRNVISNDSNDEVPKINEIISLAGNSKKQTSFTQPVESMSVFQEVTLSSDSGDTCSPGKNSSQKELARQNKRLKSILCNAKRKACDAVDDDKCSEMRLKEKAFLDVDGAGDKSTPDLLPPATSKRKKCRRSADKRLDCTVASNILSQELAGLANNLFEIPIPVDYD